MSIRQVSAIFERKCDHCGKVVQFDQTALNEDDRKETEHWTLLIKEFWKNGAPVSVNIHVCSNWCAHEALKAGIKPPAEMPEVVLRAKPGPAPHEVC